MSTITGAIEGALSSPNNRVKGIFKGIANAYKEGIFTTATLGGPGETSWGRVSYQMKIFDFAQSINKNGLEETLESYAASIFHEGTINSILKQGGIGEMLTGSAKVVIREVDNRTVKRFYVDSEKQQYVDLDLETNILAGKKEAITEDGKEIDLKVENIYEEDTDGNLILKEKIVTKTYKNGSKSKTTLNKYDVIIESETFSPNGELATTIKGSGSAPRFNANGDLLNGILETKNFRITMKDGKVQEMVNNYSPYFTDSEKETLFTKFDLTQNDLENLYVSVKIDNKNRYSAELKTRDGSSLIDDTEKAEEFNQVISRKLSATARVAVPIFTVTGGIGSEDLPENDLPNYLDVHFAKTQEAALEKEGLGHAKQHFIAMFEGENKLQDTWRILWNPWNNQLTDEYRKKLNYYYDNTEGVKFGDPISPLFYSGFGDGGLDALAARQDNAKVITLVGAYTRAGRTKINIAKNELTLNIYGSDDKFVKASQKFGVDSFGKKSFMDTDTINIEILGQGHDYFERESTANFIAEARAKAYKSKQNLMDYLNQYKVGEKDGVMQIQIRE